MNKYLIEYIKQTGKPNFERVTMLSGMNLDIPVGLCSGDCINFDEIPDVQNRKKDADSFKFTYFGSFEPQYQWQDYRSVWHNCDFKKFQFIKEKNKTVRILMKFIS